MSSLPDDPVIHHMESTGYPPGYGDKKPPECPVCGEEAYKLYRGFWNDILGCDKCVTEIDVDDFEEDNDA